MSFTVANTLVACVYLLLTFMISLPGAFTPDITTIKPKNSFTSFFWNFHLQSFDTYKFCYHRVPLYLVPRIPWFRLLCLYVPYVLR